MFVISVLLLMAAAMVTPAQAGGSDLLPGPGIQSGATQIVARAPEQSVPVERGSRLTFANCDGTLSVRTWDRDLVRITSSQGQAVNVMSSGRVVSVAADLDDGGGRYDLTVPAWMAISIKGQDCSVDVDGVSGPLVVNTVEGMISLTRIGGPAAVQTIEGSVLLDGGSGRVQVTTVSGSIKILRARGEVLASSIDGDLILGNIDAAVVEVSTVDGDVAFSGVLQPSGRYVLTTHDGDVSVEIPAASDATVGVRTFSGGKLDSTITLMTVSTGARGRRAVYRMGSGAAQLEIETFDGSVTIRKPGEKSGR